MSRRPRAFTSDCLESRRVFTPPASPQQRPAADPAAPPKLALPARIKPSDFAKIRAQRLEAKREGAPDVFLSSSAPTATIPSTLLEDYDLMQVEKEERSGFRANAGASESTAPSPAYDDDCAFDMEEDAPEEDGAEDDLFEDDGNVEFSLEVEEGGMDFGERSPATKDFVGSLGSLAGPSSFKAALPVVDGRARSLSFTRPGAGKDFTGSPVLSSCLEDLRKARSRAPTEEQVGARGLGVGGP